MTDAALNEALAKWAGWDRINDPRFPGTYFWVKGRQQLDEPLDYCRDLNAMATLEGNAPDAYWLELDSITGGCLQSSLVVSLRLNGMATARQRAEALARTVGVWRDSP